MVKYTDTAIGFIEVPNFVSLLINISNCPHKCPGCHTPYLQQDTGNELTPEVMQKLIDDHKDMIDCVCFLGEGNDLNGLAELVEVCANNRLLTCLYTGANDEEALLFVEKIGLLDFIKTGPYIEKLGPLNKKTTNQRFYKIQDEPNLGYILTDQTYLFWKGKV